MKTPQIPYANLTPDLILDAIESVGFQCNGSLLALNSYENRVYQVGIEDSQPIIVKFYRPERWSNAAILEEHAFLHELATNDIPVVAPIVDAHSSTLHELHGFRFALFPRQGGRPLELDNIDQLEWMGRFIGRLHAVGTVKRFQQRTTITTQSYGHEPYQFLLENDFIPNELKHNFCNTLDALLNQIEETFARIGSLQYIRLHGDCHAGNVLWNDRGPRIVDLDDCIMGPAIQDIWMLLSGTKDYQMKVQFERIISGYEEFCDFDYREIRLIEALRALRMINYMGWLARRWHDPAFPLNFPWFNTPRYWQEQLQHMREQLELLQESEEFGNN